VTKFVKVLVDEIFGRNVHDVCDPSQQRHGGVTSEI